MKTLSLTQQKEIKGGFRATRYCCNYAGGCCVKEYKSVRWSEGKGSYKWYTPIDFIIKHHSLTGDYYACHAVDCENY